MTTIPNPEKIIYWAEDKAGVMRDMSSAELEDDVQRMLAHIAHNDCLAEASVTMLPLHCYRLCKHRFTTRWFGDFLDLVLDRINRGPIEDKFDFYASCKSPHLLDMVGMCTAALLRYNANNPSKKDLIADMSKVPVGSVALDESGTTWVKYDASSWVNIETIGTVTQSELKRSSKGPRFLIYEADHSWKERFKFRARDAIESIVSDLNYDNERFFEVYKLGTCSFHEEGSNTVAMQLQVSKVWGEDVRSN